MRSSLTIVVLALVFGVCLCEETTEENAANGVFCPASDNGTAYIVDYESGCEAYYVCKESVLKKFRCPTGTLFTEETFSCELEETVVCERPEESFQTEQILSRNKRSLKQVLSIPKEPLQKAIQEFSTDFAPFVTKVFRSSIPGLALKILDSVPELRAVWMRFGPRVLPFIARRVRNLRLIYHKLLYEFPSLKVHANESHYNVHVSEGVISVYQFAREIIRALYFGDEYNRVKRSLSGDAVSATLTKILSSSLSKLSQLFFKLLSSDIFSDLFWSESGVGDVQRAFWSGLSALSPLVSEYYNAHGEYGTLQQLPESRIVVIPRQTVLRCYTQFKESVTPVIRNLLYKYLPRILRKASDKVPEIISGIQRFIPFLKDNWNLVKDWSLRVANKYDIALKASNSTHYAFFPMYELKRDIKPGVFLLARIATDFWGSDPDSVFPLIFGKDGIVPNILSNLEAREIGFVHDAVPDGHLAQESVYVEPDAHVQESPEPIVPTETITMCISSSGLRKPCKQKTPAKTVMKGTLYGGKIRLVPARSG